MTRCLGQWQAYVEQGASQLIRRARLDQVPAELRGQVQRHVQTVFALRRKVQARKKAGKRRLDRYK